MLGFDKKKVIVIQGGMGAGVSGAHLAGAVARCGGVGVVSSVGLDRIIGHRIGHEINQFEAVKMEVIEAIRLSEGSGAIGINFMAKLKNSYEPSIRGAIAAGEETGTTVILFVGAGLPLDLPKIVEDAPVKLVPIVSSARALDIICRQWQKIERYGRMPDGVVLEGPLAGGHLGFKPEEVINPEFQLEKLFGPTKEFAQKHENFPVFVAGGIFTNEDILQWKKIGADGVQLGTRFAATHESGASKEFKDAIIAAHPNDIVIAQPGSPTGFTFRVLSPSPGYQYAQNQDRPLPEKCKGYILSAEGCLAMKSRNYFCICKALLKAIDCNDDPSDLAIYTVGTNAWRINKILSAKDLMDELITGKVH